MKKGGKYYLYIVKCSDDSFYTGITNNITKRLRQHNGEIVGGAFYTRNKRPVKLIYKQECDNHSIAIKRELEIKKLTKAKKIRLING